MSTPQNDLEADESSGVTTLRPVPAKTARLSDLSESDSTQYFSASELLERGKALAAQASEAALAVPAPLESSRATSRAGWLAQFRRASRARQVSAVLLPVACSLLLAKPLLERPERPERAQASQPSVSASAVARGEAKPKPLTAPPATASVALVLPRGVTLARAAADSVATGDFSRAATWYRELAQRDPENQAYREAARILGERLQARTP